MAILHIGKEPRTPPTTIRTRTAMRKWIVLFALATVLLGLITATIFLFHRGFFPLAGEVIFWLFLAFVIVGLLAVVITWAALLLNNHFVVLSVVAAAVIHILLAIPIIVLTIIYKADIFVLNNTVTSNIPLFVIFLLCLVVAAALAIVALLTFLEMRKSRSVTVVRPARSEPAVAFVTTVNSSPLSRSPATSRTYQSRTQVSMASSSSSARYLS